MITLLEDERIFGSDSFIEQTKYPFSSYSDLHRFIGQTFDEEFLDTIRRERFIVNEFIEDERGLIGWKVTRKHDNGTKDEQIFYTEELVA